MIVTYLLELFNGTSVNTTALVDQVTGGGGLAGVDVSNDDDVDVRALVLTVRENRAVSMMRRLLERTRLMEERTPW
jgi:hypothetical protein